MNLDKLKALCEAATPGPWATDVAPRLAGAINATLDGLQRQVAHADGQAAMFDQRRGMETHEVMAANAAFIAAARTAVPELIAEVERLRVDLKCEQIRSEDRGASYASAAADRDSLRAECEKLKNCCICIECGRCSVDEDGCCTTCGRDALLFEDGRLQNTGVSDHIDAIERKLARIEPVWERAKEWRQGRDRNVTGTAPPGGQRSATGVALIDAIDAAEEKAK